MKQTDSYQDRLTFHPLKDILLYAGGVLIILIIFLTVCFSRSESSSRHVEIKYNNTLLFDKNDEKKSTAISFPDNGIKEVTFLKEDSSLYFDDKTSFIFDSITFTLYADHSIALLEEDVTCPDHTCSDMGRIYQSYTPIVCLPNQIQIMIVNDDFPESVN